MWSQRADGRGECRDSFASAVEAEHKAGADDGLGVAVGADDAGRRRHLGIEATDGSAAGVLYITIAVGYLKPPELNHGCDIGIYCALGK